MRALSLLQPWASLVILGLKKIESRSWAPPQSAAGRIAIHASKALKRAEADLFHEPVFRDAFLEVGIDTVDALPLGALLGTVRLIGCHPAETFTGISERERAFGNYSNEEEQRYGWVLIDPRPFSSPIPCKGALGLWQIPAELLSLLPQEAL